MDVEPTADAGDDDGNQSASPDTGDYGESNSEIEFSEEDDGDIPEDRVLEGSRRKPVPSTLVIKAARARRARRNAATGDDIQNIRVHLRRC